VSRESRGGGGEGAGREHPRRTEEDGCGKKSAGGRETADESESEAGRAERWAWLVN